MGEHLPCLIDYKLKVNMNTKQIGNLTELQCITRFYELGYAVSIPYGDSEKYDFILDINGKLYKLQCKHAKEELDVDGNVTMITIKTCWQTGYTKNNKWERHQYSEEGIDYFVTYYKGKNYLINVNECSNEKRLRILPPKNGQIKGICFLKDYLDEEVIKDL